MSFRNINAMIIPTGIGASIGGFAADGNPACKLLAKASDILLTHPNVVNAALLTDIPKNVVVLDGYLLDRFFCNQVALRLNVKHKIAVVVDGAANQEERELTQTCLDACRTVYGIDIMPEIFYTEENIGAEDLKGMKNPDTLLEACDRAFNAGATALAVLAVLNEDPESKAAQDYKKGIGHDPIGQIEAKIAHTVSRVFLRPAAHAPIIRSISEDDSETKPSAKAAAEYLSDSFLASVFKCLQHAPQVIPREDQYKILASGYVNPADLALNVRPDDIVVHQVKNLVVPYDCCNGVPMIETNRQHIEVELVCVENNTTNLDDTAELFGLEHKLAKNYLEAAGMLLANTGDKENINLQTVN